MFYNSCAVGEGRDWAHEDALLVGSTLDTAMERLLKDKKLLGLLSRSGAVEIRNVSELEKHLGIKMTEVDINVCAKSVFRLVRLLAEERRVRSSAILALLVDRIYEGSKGFKNDFGSFGQGFSGYTMSEQVVEAVRRDKSVFEEMSWDSAYVCVKWGLSEPQAMSALCKYSRHFWAMDRAEMSEWLMIAEGRRLEVAVPHCGSTGLIVRGVLLTASLNPKEKKEIGLDNDATEFFGQYRKEYGLTEDFLVSTRRYISPCDHAALRRLLGAVPLPTRPKFEDMMIKTVMKLYRKKVMLSTRVFIERWASMVVHLHKGHKMDGLSSAPGGYGESTRIFTGLGYSYYGVTSDEVDAVYDAGCEDMLGYAGAVRVDGLVAGRGPHRNRIDRSYESVVSLCDYDTSNTDALYNHLGEEYVHMQRLIDDSGEVLGLGPSRYGCLQAVEICDLKNTETHYSSPYEGNQSTWSLEGMNPHVLSWQRYVDLYQNSGCRKDLARHARLFYSDNSKRSELVEDGLYYDVSYAKEHGLVSVRETGKSSPESLSDKEILELLGYDHYSKSRWRYHNWFKPIRCVAPCSVMSANGSVLMHTAMSRTALVLTDKGRRLAELVNGRVEHRLPDYHMYSTLAIQPWCFMVETCGGRVIDRIMRISLEEDMPANIDNRTNCLLAEPHSLDFEGFELVNSTLYYTGCRLKECDEEGVYEVHDVMGDILFDFEIVDKSSTSRRVELIQYDGAHHVTLEPEYSDEEDQDNGVDKTIDPGTVVRGKPKSAVNGDYWNASIYEKITKTNEKRNKKRARKIRHETTGRTTPRDRVSYVKSFTGANGSLWDLVHLEEPMHRWGPTAAAVPPGGCSTGVEEQQWQPQKTGDSRGKRGYLRKLKNRIAYKIRKNLIPKSTARERWFKYLEDK